MAKKLTNDEKIIAALDSIDQSVRNLQKFGAKYDEHIDRAALRNDDKRAKQLIKQKIGVYSLAEQLITLKSNIELGANTAKVASDLSKLPAAIAGCKGLLAESPNFKKVGADIQKIFKDMQKPVNEISKLNEILDGVLSPQDDRSSLISRLDGEDEIENSEQFKTEWAALMGRIRDKVATETITKPAETVTVGATGDVDFAGIMSDVLKEEKNKK